MTRLIEKCSRSSFSFRGLLKCEKRGKIMNSYNYFSIKFTESTVARRGILKKNILGLKLNRSTYHEACSLHYYFLNQQLEREHTKNCINIH